MCVSSSYILQSGYTPFLVACEYQKLEMMRYFMQLPGVDIEACCHGAEGMGATGLHLAAYHNALGVAELLIEAGCRLDAVDKNVSPLLCATPCITPTLQGNTALHVANIRCSHSVAREIKEACREKGIMDRMNKVKNKVSVKFRNMYPNY
jgi:ankyrin repeat protein